MKKYFLFALTILTIAFFGLKAEDKLSAEKLIKSFWSYEDSSSTTYSISFMTEGKVQLTPGYEVRCNFSGDFAISGNSVTIKNFKSNKCGEEISGFDAALECNLEPIKDSIFFTEQLNCNGGKFVFKNHAATVPGGTLRSINKTEVQVMKKKMTTTANLSIRKAPSTKSERIFYKERDNMGLSRRPRRILGNEIRLGLRRILEVGACRGWR